MLSKFEIAIIASLTSLFTLVSVNLVMNGSFNPGGKFGYSKHYQ